MSDLHSTYPLPELLARWARGDLTVEQLAGQLLQYVIQHDQRLDQLEKIRGRGQGGSSPSSDAMSAA